MALKAQFLGRDAVMRRLGDLVPEAEKDIAAAQMEAAEDLAGEIESRAPIGDGPTAGDYRASIRAGRLADRALDRRVGGQVLVTNAGKQFRATKDPNATGVFASFKWRWIEFGTKERFRKSGASSGVMPRQPHVMPTYRAARPRIRRKIAAALRKAIRRTKG